MNHKQETWLQALEGDEYQQGRDRLKYDSAFCCLGVACDLEVKAGRGVWDGNKYFPQEGQQGAIYVLPDYLNKELGLSQLLHNAVGEMNDSGKFTFKQIAAFLRHELAREKTA